MTERKKSIVFVCFGNACRSQMAEGWGRHLGGDEWEAYSAGSNPAGWVAPHSVRVMAEKGIDIAGHYSKGVGELPIQEFDYVVTMGCGDNCPTLKAGTRLDWQIPDPVGQSEEVFRQVRDDLEKRIRNLLGA